MYMRVKFIYTLSIVLKITLETINARPKHGLKEAGVKMDYIHNNRVHSEIFVLPEDDKFGAYVWNF